MESSRDIGGPKYPWPVIDRKMKSSWVDLSPGCHSMIKLYDDPRIIVLTRHHEWLQMVSLTRSMESRSPGFTENAGRS